MGNTRPENLSILRRRDRASEAVRRTNTVLIHRRRTHMKIPGAMTFPSPETE